MLEIDKSLQVAGQTVYRDTEIPHKFYLMGEPMYRRNQNGHPKFALIKYRWDPNIDGARGGGLLLFDFCLSIDKEVLENVGAELRGLLENEASDRRAPEIGLIPFSDGGVTVSFSMADTDESMRLPVDPRDNCSASVILPLSVKSVSLLAEALKTDKSIFSLTYELKANGRQKGDVVTTTFSHSAMLTPLVALRDVTGNSLDPGQFVSRVDLQASRFFNPLVIDVIVMPEFKACGVSRCTVYLEPEGGPSLKHEFTHSDERHQFAAHNDSHKYEYWYEIYLDNGKVVKSSRKTAEDRVLMINLREIVSGPVDVIVMPEFKACGVSRCTVYLEPEGGPSLKHEFTHSDERHQFAAHNDSHKYEYWYEIYLDNGKVVKSSRKIAEQRALRINLRENVLGL